MMIEIQRDLVSYDLPLSAILRKAKILASRLDHQEFRSWVNGELDGYGDDKPLPDYRVLVTQSRGDFSGMFGSGLKNAPVAVGIPEIDKFGSSHQIREGIKALESLLAAGEDLRVYWDPKLVAIIQDKVYENMVCLQAWKVLSRASVEQVIDTARNRLLDFILELQKEFPTFDNRSGSLMEPNEKDKVGTIFNTYILGDRNNVNAVGSGSVTQTVTTAEAVNDFDAVHRELKKLGVSDEDSKDLQEALEQDAKDGTKKGLGQRAQTWIGKMAGKALESLPAILQLVTAYLESQGK